MLRVRFFAGPLTILAVLSSNAAGAYTLTVSPATVVADTGALTPVTVCLKDAAGGGPSGVGLSWTNYSGGNASVAGIGGVQGTVTTATGGCVQVSVGANSVPPNQSTDYIAFAAPAGYNVLPAKLTLSATWSLQLVPNTLSGNGTQQVVATLSGGAGTGQPSVTLQLSCQSSGGVLVAVSNPTVSTDSAGRAVFSLTPSGAIGFNTTPASAVCSVTTAYAGAVATATVTAKGLNVCTLGYLPQPPACGDPAP